MAIYAIGDLHGCLDQLKELLESISFNPDEDTLWFVGDLVGRGTHSLETLRFVRALPKKVVVLGNHDMHLLALKYFPGRRANFPALEAIFEAPDKDELFDWLLQQPLLHHEEIAIPELALTDPTIACEPNSQKSKCAGYVLVHAGILPEWDLAFAKAAAVEVETALRENPQLFFEHMYGNKPDRWHDSLTGFDRLRFMVNCFTRMRFCDYAGRLNLTCKAKLGEQPAGYVPWFQLPNRRITQQKILFGHWAALEAQTGNTDVIALDAGCVWGHALLALRLGDERKFFVACYPHSV